MGALVAGVSLSTFPYALDVTAKVTTLRDFFITLFFVALGMTIPMPGLSVIGLALVIAAFTVVSRLVTTFLPLYLMKQGLRASLLPAINLAQISEFSLVVIQTGVAAGHITTETASAASFAFVVLAVLEHLRDDAQRPDHALADRPAEADRLARSRSRPRPRRGRTRGRPRRGAPHRHPRLFPRRQRAAGRDRAAEPGRCSSRSRVVDFNPDRVPDAVRPRPARDLRRHQQRRHAAACRHRQRRDHHPERAGFAAQGRQQRKAGPPRPHAQSDRQDRRHRRSAVRRRAISTRPAPTTSP